MIPPLPYCGTAPLPAEILSRFNFDPLLLTGLALLCVCHWLLLSCRSGTRIDNDQFYALGGWLVASAALVSPLCALSVALFSARVTQHMLLILVAAPLLAIAFPPSRRGTRSWPLWANTAEFFLLLWFWHMPVPYEATFASVNLYWTMHVTLFASSVLLWRELINHRPQGALEALAATTLTFMHMGVLGAVLAFAQRPLYYPHLFTTQAWGMTTLQDQQLGGTLMWVPGIAVGLWIGIRSVSRMWTSIERARPA